MREPKGRFKKKDDMKISFELPSIKKLVLWILLFAILFLWIAILLRLNILKSLMDAFE